MKENLFFLSLLFSFHVTHDVYNSDPFYCNSCNPNLIKEIVLDITADDGVKLKATYYSPGIPGPGMLLLHQCNMDRKSWESFARTLAERGIHVLTFDYRGYGETPGTGGREHLTDDIDSALSTLSSQNGVDKNKIAVGGASCGVNNAVQLAKRNGNIKALMLLSGPSTQDGLTWLKENSAMPIFGAASSEEDFAVQAISEMVAASKNTESKMIILKNAGHGAPMFTAEPPLLTSVTNWVVKVLK